VNKNRSPLPEGDRIKKEINAMPSQKNGAVVRQVMGYDHFVGEHAY
jgi:hypothetical protein